MGFRFLGEYFISVFVCAVFLGVVSYLSYPGASERTAKIASGILLFYTVAVPLAGVIGEIQQVDKDDIFIDISENGSDFYKYEESAKYVY